VRCPIAVNDASTAGNVTVELFFGKSPSIKFDLNQETILTVIEKNSAFVVSSCPS
jgi:hypothetical protein